MNKSRRHALGQHFLINQGVLRKIIGVIDPKPDEVIVEIGPGKGALTVALAEKAGHIVAIEKDERLIPGLREKMPPNVEVIHGDILRTDLREVSKRAGVPALRLVGNIPYSISSPLLFRVLDERDVVSDCIVLLQKEVAERLTAGPGTKSYAPLGILLQNEFEARIEFSVAAGSFSPPPKVQSGLPESRLRRAPQDALEKSLPPRHPSRPRGGLRGAGLGSERPRRRAVARRPRCPVLGPAVLAPGA
jgi:16S rRNA (adenine1518-N6/adenine1519-N6)-dimethyltransferase